MKIKLLILSLLLLIPIATATITFNDWITLTGNSVTYGDRLYVVWVNSSGTTGHYTKPTSYDIFSDSPTVGDKLAYGWNRGVWTTLNLTIDVPISATSVNIDWYYLNVYGTYNPLNVTSDGTNNFTTAGNNLITFEVPDCWTQYYNFGGAEGDGYWIVANLTSFSGLTEGGHINAEADGGNYAINFYNGSYTLSDLYTADLSNGWGVMSNIASYYHLDSNLIMGYTGQSTNLTIDDGDMFEIGMPTKDYQDECNDAFYKKRTFLGEQSGDNFTIGKNDSTGIYESSTFKYNGHYYGQSRYNYFRADFNLLASLLYRTNTGFNDMGMFGNNFNFINSVIGGKGNAQPPYIVSNANGIINNVVMSIDSATQYWYLYSSSVDYSNIIMSHGLGTVVGSSANISNMDYGTDKVFQSGNANVKTGCINCKFTDFDTQSNPSSSGNEIRFFYTIDFEVFNESYAPLDFNITVKNTYGETLYAGNYSTWGNKNLEVYYEHNNGTKIDNNPFTFIIDSQHQPLYETTFNVTDTTRHQTITLKPSLNGTLVISNGQIKIFR